MAVKGPMTRRIRADQVAHALRGLHDDRVFIGIELSVPIVQLTPQTMQMDRVTAAKPPVCKMRSVAFRACSSRDHGLSASFVRRSADMRSQSSRRSSTPEAAAVSGDRASLTSTQAQALPSWVIEANNRVMEMVFEAGRKALSAPSSAPSEGAKGRTKKGADRSSTLVSTLKGGS